MSRLVEHHWVCDWSPCGKKSDALETGFIWTDDYPAQVYPPDGWIEHQYGDRHWRDIITNQEKTQSLQFCCQEHLDLWKQARVEVGLGITE